MNYQNAFERPGADHSASRISLGAAPRISRDGVLPFRERLASLWRAWPKLALWLFVCVGLALAYCLTATPKFLATTGVVLEPRQPVLSTDAGGQSTAPTLDSALADSQVQVLMSRRNLAYVFDVQHLADDPEFTSSGFDPIGWLLQHVSPADKKPASPAEAAQRAQESAFERFASQVTVRRLAQSYAFELSYAAQSPAKAAKLANAITAAYIRDKLNYNISAAAAQRGGDFLRNRVSR